MSEIDKAKSAELLIQLYDLRREKVMREARDWVFGFHPKSADEYVAKMMEEGEGAYLRMVTSYWEMAAGFVNHGAIDRDMFCDANGEHMVVFAKIEPLLADLREKFQNPDAFRHLEKLIDDQP
ncbi:MAG: hypothetical protein KDB79_16930, partial [Acidobacteria bacterium]|nr:hypothetical protein [Acidobacteriota bacterium]